MQGDRRSWLAAATGIGIGAAGMAGEFDWLPPAMGDEIQGARSLKIRGLRVTPIALPDPPLLAASGCHGPYFLRNVIEIETESGVTGIGETRGGEEIAAAIEQVRPRIIGQSAAAYRRLAAPLKALHHGAYAGVELACLDALGKATGRRLCELLGGPVREAIEFSAYLFYRYAADHPRLIDDPRIVDDRGRGRDALDDWGEVRSPAAMAEMALKFHERWGFRTMKLKAGVLRPEVEVETLQAINEKFAGRGPLRIDPNGRWSVETAVKMAERMRDLPLEYYEDPVRGQAAMAEVRRRTGLTMSTNMCVTRFAHVAEAVKTEPIDVVLCDHHGWGGIPTCQALGTLADALGWRLSQHSNNHAGVTMAAMAHLGAVIPQLTLAGDTHYVWLPNDADIIQGPKLSIQDGKLTVPRGPGLGVSLDRDKLAQAHEVYRKCGMRRRDDANTMRRVEPGWQRTLY